MTDEATRHGPGGNNPPADPFANKMAEKHEDLLDLEADLLLAAGRLPADVASDEDVARITKWVRDARDLAKTIEDRRVDEKAPYLERGKAIDGWFGKFREQIAAQAKAIEQRSTSYLQAKRAREAAEARAKAEAAEKARREEEAKAAEARRQEREAQEATAKAERALADAARKSQADAAAAEAALRRAQDEQARTAREADEAGQRERRAALASERADRRAEEPAKLGKTGGGGGNASVRMVPGYRIDSWPKLQQSLGPLGTYVDARWLEAPLQRWAKIAQNKPEIREEIPGVAFIETAETRTAATWS